MYNQIEQREKVVDSIIILYGYGYMNKDDNLHDDWLFKSTYRTNSKGKGSLWD